MEGVHALLLAQVVVRPEKGIIGSREVHVKQSDSASQSILFHKLVDVFSADS